jgi:hypothetical protein
VPEAAAEPSRSQLSSQSRAKETAEAQPRQPGIVSKESLEKQRRKMTRGRVQMPPVALASNRTVAAPISLNLLAEPYKCASR